MTEPTDDYWPEPLKHIPLENADSQEWLCVGEMTGTEDPYGHRRSFIGLVEEDDLNRLLESSDIGSWMFQSAGPRPYPSADHEYVPWFRINCGKVIPGGIEPLIAKWDKGATQILVPDNGFLMTYALVPRFVCSEDILYWDDLHDPRLDIVKCRMVYEGHNTVRSRAFVYIHRDYLEDYATLRGRHLVQIYSESNMSILTPQDADILGNDSKRFFDFPGRSMNITTEYQPTMTLRAVVWGVRQLISPGKLPITEGRDYGQLTWPGIDSLVTENYFGSKPMPFVYINDAVLREYECRPDLYEINPEMGAVSYSDQWGVGHCHRVGRDLIRVELKKLYEGTPPFVVRHWHSFAVEKPKVTPEALREDQNVAIRSKRIVFGLLKLGESLAALSESIGGASQSAEDFVKVDRQSVQYHDWWRIEIVRPITHHIPKAMGKDDFLRRCEELEKFIIEGLGKAQLRIMLSNIGTDCKDITEFGSLRLLNRVVMLAVVANKFNLNLTKDIGEIESRGKEMDASIRKDENDTAPTYALFLLYDLRLESAHRKNDVDALLKRLGAERAALVSGWGLLMDDFYDLLGESLEDISGILQNAIPNSRH